MPPGSGQTKKQMPQPVQPAPAVFGGMVAVVVQALGKVQDFGRAGLDAESASLTFFGVHGDRSAVWFGGHLVHLRDDRPNSKWCLLSRCQYISR